MNLHDLCRMLSIKSPTEMSDDELWVVLQETRKSRLLTKKTDLKLTEKQERAKIERAAKAVSAPRKAKKVAKPGSVEKALAGLSADEITKLMAMIQK